MASWSFEGEAGIRDVGVSLRLLDLWNFLVDLTLHRAPCIALAWDEDDQGESTTSVGELLPNMEAKIMNEDASSEVSRGAEGEIWLRGPNVMKGYWRNVKASQEAVTSDGWLKTGDIARVDETGKFFIVDRKKVGTRQSLMGTKLIWK